MTICWKEKAFLASFISTGTVQVKLWLITLISTYTAMVSLRHDLRTMKCPSQGLGT